MTQRYTNEQILQILRNRAKRLEKTKLTGKDIAAVIPVYFLNNRFGSIRSALVAAGLEPGPDTGNQYTRIADELLLRAVHDVEQTVGHEPRYCDNIAFGHYSAAPYRRRYGHWANVIAHYRQWKGQDLPSQPPVDQRRAAPPESALALRGPQPKQATIGLNKKKRPAPIYGEPIDFRGLRHAPTNEQGVVALFAIVSRDLGFNIESIQQGFPDCRAKFLYDKTKNLWTNVRIELEYRARAFVEHKHDHTQCDFIVCWINDWPQCPITVIELKTEIQKLPPR
jgi:hypothetical protein